MHPTSHTKKIEATPQKRMAVGANRQPAACVDGFGPRALTPQRCTAPSQKTRREFWPRRLRATALVAIAVAVLGGGGCRQALTAGDLKAVLPGPKEASKATVDGVRAAMLRLRAPPARAPTTQDGAVADARALRSELLDAYFRGAPAAWRAAGSPGSQVSVVKGAPINRGKYVVQPLRFEALPGMWIPAVLYTPVSKGPRRGPAVLSVNGHGGKKNDDLASDFVQARAINLAKRGLTVLSVEWFDQGQLRVGSAYRHDRVAALEALGVAGTAPFLASLRTSLVTLLQEPTVDADKVAMVGLSGGGWQTIVLAALDERIAAANPVAGYTTLVQRAAEEDDMGDWEQSAWGLQRIADFDAYTNLVAPRPLLLTFNAKDNCCYRADRALKPLLEAAAPRYALFGASKNLQSHVDEDPGTHNMERGNREAFYAFVIEHFGLKGVSATELEYKSDLVPRADLAMPLPKDQQTLASLVKGQQARIATCAKEPSTADCPEADTRPLAARLWPEDPTHWKADVTAKADIKGHTHQQIRFSGDGFVVFADAIRHRWQKTISVVLVDKGRKEAGPLAETALKDGGVVLVDLPFVGSAAAPKNNWLYARQLAPVAASPLGIESRALLAIIEHFSAQGLHVNVYTDGPRSGLVATAAAAQQPGLIVSVFSQRELRKISKAISKKYTSLPEAFPFGVLPSFDVSALKATALPTTFRALDSRELAHR